MGFLFLGAGTSIPEAVSSVIATMEGNVDIGISNAIGSNIFDILFCLGVSWTLRTLIAPLISGKSWVSKRKFNFLYVLKIYLIFFFNLDCIEFYGYHIFSNFIVSHTHNILHFICHTKIQFRSENHCQLFDGLSRISCIHNFT